MANDTEFGLAAYFYSRDIGRVWRVAEALEYGIVGINEGITSTEIAPFGGMKESGNWPRGLAFSASMNSSRSYFVRGAAPVTLAPRARYPCISFVRRGF